MGRPVSEFVYAFAHPEEYTEAGWSPRRDDDGELLAALLEALQHVYASPHRHRPPAPPPLP